MTRRKLPTVATLEDLLEKVKQTAFDPDCYPLRVYTFGSPNNRSVTFLDDMLQNFFHLCVSRCKRRASQGRPKSDPLSACRQNIIDQIEQRTSLRPLVDSAGRLHALQFSVFEDTLTIHLTQSYILYSQDYLARRPLLFLKQLFQQYAPQLQLDSADPDGSKYYHRSLPSSAPSTESCIGFITTSPPSSERTRRSRISARHSFYE